MKKTLVIGASVNPERYSFMAIHSLLKKEHSVVAIAFDIDNLTYRYWVN